MITGQLILICSVGILLLGAADAASKRSQRVKGNDFVKKVHIIYMNHLDVGYQSYINDVLNEYFTKYFPLAVKIANELVAGGYVETFIYTTHPWLVSLYLDCPPNLILAGIKLQCPNATEKAAFVGAVQRGQITWHAGPMNLQIEMAEQWLFESSFDISADLDKRFNITRNLRVLSQRDVPGITHAAIPSMVRRGVAGVSIGVNNQTPPPVAPPLFIWKYGSESVMATIHPGGYPDNPGPNPAHPGGLSRRDCVVINGFTDALCFAFRTDNSGPPTSVEEILGYYEILRVQFPSAELQASRLEDFFEAALSIKDTLPVLTNEIGDTWIQGVASDPRKCAEYRAVSRVMRNCLLAGQCDAVDPLIVNATRFLIKLPEHTWGLPTENDNIHWSNEEFQKLRLTSPNFLAVANSWEEQRKFTDLTIEALSNHSVVRDIYAELSHLKPGIPDLTGFVQITDTSKVFQCASGNIKALQFGPDGSVISLNYNGIDWASNEFSLSSLLYTSYNQTDFDDLTRLYNYGGYGAGFYKKNITLNAHPDSKTWPVTVVSLYANQGAECDFYVNVALLDKRAVMNYGAPQTVWLRYTVRSVSASVQPGLDIEFQWFNKTITRLPEAITLSFKIAPQTDLKWWMSKLNRMVDPNNVLLNGSQFQHVLDDGGAVYSKPDLKSGVRIRSPDVPIACPILADDAPHIFPVPLQPLTGQQLVGMGFNAYNNLWDTNYIMWYPYMDGTDGNFKARFKLEFFQA